LRLASTYRQAFRRESEYFGNGSALAVVSYWRAPQGEQSRRWVYDRIFFGEDRELDAGTISARCFLNSTLTTSVTLLTHTEPDVASSCGPASVSLAKPITVSSVLVLMWGHWLPGIAQAPTRTPSLFFVKHRMSRAQHLMRKMTATCVCSLTVPQQRHRFASGAAGGRGEATSAARELSHDPEKHPDAGQRESVENAGGLSGEVQDRFVRPNNKKRPFSIVQKPTSETGKVCRNDPILDHRGGVVTRGRIHKTLMQS